MNDFYVDDAHVIGKLRAGGDREIVDRLDNLRFPLDENPDLSTVAGHHRPHKFRFVDPEFLTGGRLIKLTEVNEQYAQAVAQRAKEASQGFVI